MKANLFYRGLTFHRFPVIGDTLFTRTEVVGLKQNSAKPGRAPTGLAALRMTTVDQIGRLVLDFYRCAMLPLSADTPRPVTPTTCPRSAPTSRRRPTRPPTGTPTRSATRVPGAHFDSGLAGAVLHSTADVVSSAPELARLTLNIAATHHDSRVGGQRLVYGGHTIGLALAQATRLLPNLVTVLGWESCDHTGPVHEGDTLYSELHVEGAVPLPDGRGGVLKLRSLVYAVGEPRPPSTGLAVHRAAVLSDFGALTPAQHPYPRRNRTMDACWAFPSPCCRGRGGRPTRFMPSPASRSTPRNSSPAGPRCSACRHKAGSRRAAPPG